jgi:uncharacterized protein YuzE
MSAFRPYAEYLPQIDILYVRLREAEIARTLNLGHWRNVDLDARGNVVAVEFIDVTHEGVDLTDVPEGEAVLNLIRTADLPVVPRLSA